MDLKPFFLKITYGDEHDIDMIKMLWEDCLPKSYLLYLKKPDNFELINSEKSNFKTIKNLVQQYMGSSENCQNLRNSFQRYHEIYQYIYSHVFPKTYSKKAGFSKQVQFTQQFNSWKQKMQKNPFNFTTEQIRHPMEQKPIEIKIYDDIDFKAYVIDTKPLPPVPKTSPERFLYAPTMVGNQDFDRKFKLPKQKKTKNIC